MERRTWTRSTNKTSLTKDTVKRHDSIMEDSGEKEQYSKTSIFGRICQRCTTHEQATFTLNHHHTTTPDKQQTIREYAKNNASEFFQNQRTQINAQRLQQEKISVPRTNQTQDPPTLCSKQQEARRATLSECTFSSKKRTSLERLLQDSNFKTT